MMMGRKASKRLKEIGWKPPVRGGNGCGPTKAEKMLISILPQELIWNYGIKTGKWNGSGYPPVYKVDIAIPEIRLAIEADGNSHCSFSQKRKDLKKDQFLEGLGWTVVRLSNKRILNESQAVKKVLLSIIYTLKLTTAIPLKD
jgi:very-short-patch-repair endonuclease